MSIAQKSRAAAEKLLDYLAAEFDDQGVSTTAPGNAQYYYKLPAVLAYSGWREPAYRILEQFVDRFMKGGQLDLSADPAAGPWTPYIGGWAATGAGMLGRFDLARTIMKTVQTFRDDATGGYRYQAPGATPVLDIEQTGSALMGCVWTGDFTGGHAAAGFLQTLLHQQPSPRDVFDARMGLDGRLVHDSSDPSAHYSFDDPFASPAIFGTTIAGLVWLARSTGDDELIELASAYLHVAMEHHSDPAKLLLATKFGWTALMVGAHRETEALSKLAARCAANLIERQRPDGSISLHGLPAAFRPDDKQWLIVLGCDCSLTLMAVADGAA